ncbi:MAG: signal peptidase II [Clostridiales bacterium]|nr:signal peptidase II [Clostridiales bacterium]
MTMLIVFLILLIDQTTKYYAFHLLGEKRKIVLIKSILELRYIENTGAAFGSFAGENVAIMVTAMFIILFLLLMYRKLYKTGKYYNIRLAMVILMSGAVGNLIDRMTHGFVIDFIYFVPIDFPKFNFADICIVLSMLTIGYLFLFVYTEDEIEGILK